MALQVSNSVRVCNVSESGIDLQTGVSILFLIAYFASALRIMQETVLHALHCIIKSDPQTHPSERPLTLVDHIH